MSVCEAVFSALHCHLIIPQDGINNYTCACVAGWADRNCEANINDCDPNPCENGGACEVSSPLQSLALV